MRDNKQPSFAERAAQMHDASEQLKLITKIVALEAMRMAAAEKRFGERNARKRNGDVLVRCACKSHRRSAPGRMLMPIARSAAHRSSAV